VTGQLVATYDEDALVVTIDNPPLNVMTAAAWDALDGHLDEALRRGVRGVIVTGAGERAFCAGSNIDEMLDLDEVSGTAWSRRNYAVREKLRQFPWPVVAAVNGMALGGGLALALACDLRVSVRTAEFGLPEARVGLVGTANYLLRYFPPGKVKELVFTGRRIPAQEAHDWGLVERLVEPGEALAVAHQVLAASRAMSPLALRLYKSTINQGLNLSLEASLSVELERLQECWGSDERRAWVQSYLEARAARAAARAGS
jgi:enoyl-CoA hydratase